VAAMIGVCLEQNSTDNNRGSAQQASPGTKQAQQMLPGAVLDKSYPEQRSTVQIGTQPIITHDYHSVHFMPFPTFFKTSLCLAC
jgi:hypothetical protein